MENQDIMKRFSDNIKTPSFNKRKSLFFDLNLYLDDPGVKKDDIAVALKAISRALGAYREVHSFRLVRQLVGKMVAVDREASIICFTEAFKDTVERFKMANSLCLSTSSEALMALKLSCILMDGCHGDKLNLTPLMEQQMVLFTACLPSLPHRAILPCRDKYFAAFVLKNHHLLSRYIKALTSSSSPLTAFSMVGFFLNHLKKSNSVPPLSNGCHGDNGDTNHRILADEMKKVYLRHYIEGVLKSRVKVKQLTLTSLMTFLTYLNDTEFTSEVMPSISKALLRNPEITLVCLRDCIKGMTIDLSTHALSIGKHLASQCLSKDCQMHTLAQQTIIHLCRQCTNHQCIQDLLSHFFDVLTGSEGKAAMTKQKMALLTCIGESSAFSLVHGNSTLSSTSQLALSISERFISFIQSEGHEVVCTHAILMMIGWSSKIRHAPSKSLVQSMEKVLTNKSSPSNVRTAILRAYNASVNAETREEFKSVLPALSKIIETVHTGISVQNFQVTECVHACLLCLNLCYEVPQLATKQTAAWSLLLDCDKQHFTNAKFLSQAGKDVLQSLCSLVFLLFRSYPSKLQDKHLSMYSKCLISCIVKGDSGVRMEGMGYVRKLSSSPPSDHPSLPSFLAEAVSEVLRSFQHLLASANEDQSTTTTTSFDHRIFYQLYERVGVGVRDEEIARGVALEALVEIHHPEIVKRHSCPWGRLLQKMRLKVGDLVSNHYDLVFEAFKMNAGALSQKQQNALSSLAQLAPKETFLFVKEKIMPIYSNHSYSSISYNDNALLTWPVGELFDRSIIESFSAANKNQANMKRENKLYSYEEQMAELELKKEMSKKKGKGGGKQELSKKQQEMVLAQVLNESNIRINMQHLLDDLLYANSLVEACMQGNQHHTRLSFIWLLPIVHKLCKSVMAAPTATAILVKLAFVAFNEEEQHYLAISLAHCILRHSKPECEVDANWTKESLTLQSERLIEVLFNITGCTLDDLKSFEQPLTTTTFHYALLLIQSLLRTGFLDDDWQVKCLVLITCHANSRAHASTNEKSPHHLPLHCLIDLCLQLITTSPPTTQHHAHQTILHLASAANGDEGCVGMGEDSLHSLIDAILSHNPSVRQAALQALKIVKAEVDCKIASSKEQQYLILSRIWLCRFDVLEGNRGLAESLFQGHHLPTEASFFTYLIQYVVHKEDSIRVAASASLSAALQAQPNQMTSVLKQLLECYEDKLYIPPVPKDQFGRVEQGYIYPSDDYQSRCGVAMVIGKMGELLDGEGVEEVVKFVVGKGLLDRHPLVQQEMLKTAITITNTHGKENMDFLFKLFEDFLTTAPSTAMYDTARQGVAILMGTLAKHLSSDSEKLKPIVGRLVGTLSTPSEEVQSAVATCLYPLVGHLKADAPEMVKSMLNLLFTSDDYGQRRGAAYGLAGLVKGLGILSLKQLDIITALTTAIQDKKNPRHKEGALFAFEMLCKMLERLFEPYVVHLLPHLLICFGDPSQNIRDAADDTAKMVMSKLSGHGVKLVLPSLLSALEEDSWRTKCGSVELLGAMAYCAPKQLSACLPSIVPKITEVLTDSHIKVQNAGSQALSQIGAVIRNPEIQAVVPVLLRGIQDPVGGTTKALEKLLATKFVHFIDAPSLALIMPVVERALMDRSSDTRKMAAQIIANMYSLTDQKDLSPYLPTMVPGLKEALLSPMPEVRTASARAFGTMVKSMGEKGVGDLLPWLFDTLTSEASTVDRSGAAQGLAEVVGGLGMGKLNEMMPDVIETTSRVDINPCVRDGYIMLYIYLPPAFGDDFIPYVGPIIPTILQALADETEFVRETALKAGQKMVQQYADTAIELLLPEVEKGLFDDNWRIRYSSIHLMGDLLFRISGVTGKMTTQGKDEDDNFGTEASQKAILRALGADRFNRVFSGLYVCRHDSSLNVRHAALHVWKVIVSHTPRTLREIMPTLFKLLLTHLASTTYDKRHMAALTLGDIVRKLGEKVLPEIIPILEQSLDSEDFERRQGVCFGLSEIINSTGQDHVIAFAGNLIPTIRRALMDDSAAVREAAALTFGTLHSNLGPRCIDDILPALLEQLKNPEKRDSALDGLRQVILVKGRVVLPHLIPTLTAEPVNSKALSFLVSAAGESLNKHLGKILQALVRALAAKVDDPVLHAQELGHCRLVMLSLQDEDAVQNCIEILLDSAVTMDKNPPSCRQAALQILNVFCAETRVDYGEYVIRMIRAMILLAGDDYAPLLHAAWDCLNSIIKKVEPVNMVQHISQMRQAMRLVSINLSDNQLLPGFSLPKKGIAPLVLVFREAILTGSPEIKESATVGLTDAIKRSSPEALKPSVINITGALIRILGERFGFNVKVAMLDSVGLLLRKCGANMKAFLPQLQTTFLKTLNDSNKLVRLRSAKAIGSLVDIHNRIDPLFNELIGMVKSSDDFATRASVIQAIRLCLSSPNCKLQEKTQKDLLSTLRLQTSSSSSSSSAEEETVVMVAAACLGALCGKLQEELLKSVIAADLLDSDNSGKYICSTALSVALNQSAPVLFSQPAPTLDNINKASIQFASSDRVPTKLRAVRCLTFYLKHQLTTQSTPDQTIVDALYKAMKSDSSEVKQACCSAISYLAVHCHDELLSNNQLLVSMTISLLLPCKDRQQVVRVAAEHSLVTLLCLRTDDSLFQTCLDSMEHVDRESLIDVSNKSLKRLKLQAPIMEEDFDNTFI